jgi:tRNA pseudouridine13 synthase
MRILRDDTFPLLAPDSVVTDPKKAEAVEWVLGKEKLKLADLRIEEEPRRLYFKHEERPLLVFPHKLVIGRTQNDELNRDAVKVNVAFTLPPGAYATLVVKRLFHFSWREDTAEEIRASQRPRLTETLRQESTVAPPRRPGGFPARPQEPREPAPARAAAEPREPPPGFRERQRLKKEAKVRARADMAGKASKSQKKK